MERESAKFFDTLEACRELEAVGFDRGLAEAIVRATKTIVEAVREDAAAFDASAVLGELEAAGFGRGKAEAFVRATAKLARRCREGSAPPAGRAEPGAGLPN